MDNENENLDSSNEETETTDSENGENIKDLKSKNVDLEEKNKQLFSRAKKAEGFELKDGEWVKKEELPKDVEPEAKAEPSRIDYGQLAFHNSKSESIKIEAEEDVEYLEQQIKETGKSQNYLLNAKWFQSELKAKQESRTKDKEVKDATPPTTKRSVPSAKDTVEYWRGKPFEDVPKNMKQKVLNAQLEEETKGSQFADQPVIRG